MRRDLRSVIKSVLMDPETRTVPDAADDVGPGRLLPSTSVDQYAAALGKWFGLSDPQLDTVLPKLGNFGSARTLGFV